MDEHTCKRCGHTWTAYVKAPLCCPRCKRYTWRVPPAHCGRTRHWPPESGSASPDPGDGLPR